MGTSGSYSGAGGKVGRDLRQGVADWIDSLPSSPPSDQGDKPGDNEPYRLPPEALLDVIPLLRPHSRPAGGGGSAGGGGGGGGTFTAPSAGGGASGGGRGGSASRSTRRAATSAGRAAAVAYAYGTGNREALSRFGLDYDQLRAITDPLELTRRIVDAACGPRADSTIEDHERRYVAAEVAEWVLSQTEGGSTPQPEEIVRKAIATIIAEIFDTEIGEMLRRGERPPWIAELAESEIREAAEVLAERAELSVGGVTEEEFSRAVEDGIDTLRRITQGKA